ncbi:MULTISPECIES: aldo/keto reductase [unclassified Rhizobium]|uniref:aldo/keto reductase n=1 Tax=unclassified Rhizobium TaxID=2613769 RepID=UPI000714CB1D|nr:MULTISPECIES: aldo/keto reductase [unclassified Rhizobium]KQS96620.1 aldo/keto reductase [Rhizobium sp. Leaf386]KQT06459.1 aldo/keto reductase [Rhizobium sp. Leaf391]KQT92530.1 aldo/keto reductase [Rhizobium sp. Leaf453]
MKYKTLGRTGIQVSEICLGTMTWGTQNSEAEAHGQMNYAVDQGINFFDTAELYPVTPAGPETRGLTEDYIGTWLKASGKREDIIVATKVTGPGRPYIRNGSPASPKTMREALDISLKRLQTDYIDLYQMHWPNRGHYHFRQSWTYDPSRQDTNATRDDLLAIHETLAAFVKEGKVRHVGLCNDTAWGTMTMLALAEKHGLPRIASIQNEYNFLYRSFDLDLAEVSHHENVGLLAYSPLAAGLLSGKYLNGARPKGSRLTINGDLGGRYTEHQEPAVAAYAALAETYGLDLAQMQLAFSLTRPFMTSVIIGATTMEQLKTDIGAKDVTLSADVLAGIAKLHKMYPAPI